ncbi:MAG: glycosyltransferase family 4 protein [Rivularia sp. (in: Bacteria)]|nr:glycosyltransferase family 4 protein [Rivularia sp. MS3]
MFLSLQSLLESGFSALSLKSYFDITNPFLILLAIGFFASLITVGIIKQNLSQQLVDIPNERSSHTQPTPRGGGLGFIVAFAIAIGLSQFFSLYTFNSEQNLLWLSLIPLVLIGIIDDWKGVPAGVRYLVQLLTSSLIVIQSDAFPFPILNQLGTAGDIISILLTIVGITAIINFYNFMDGLDGLVAGVTAIQLAFLAIWFNQPLNWLVIAVLIGFLYWNWSPAKIFMGDAGSTFLGAVIAIALLNNTNHPAYIWSGLTITLPLVGDAIYTIICRLIRGENIFKAHRTHLYQRLQQSGWSHAQVATTYIVFTLFIANLNSLLGETGAWISLASVIAAIFSGEAYLNRQQFKGQKTEVKGQSLEV